MHIREQTPKATRQTTPAKPSDCCRSCAERHGENNARAQWQRTIGNQAVRQLHRMDVDGPGFGGHAKATDRRAHEPALIPLRFPAGRRLQSKLTVNAPGDVYEQEADRVADQVMRMPDLQLPGACSRAGGCAGHKREQNGQSRLQTKAVRNADGGQAVASPVVQQVISSPGQSLDSPTRSFMESRFGHDFSGVRVHTGERAAESTRALSARAYTVSRNIVFGAGQYAPGTHTGRSLLAHELTHVVQQSGGRAPRLQRAISEDSIRTKNGDFYSTHCGWVDTGHANPKLPRNLIAHVREASKRIERRQKTLSKKLAGEPPVLVSETSCSATYEKGEQAASRTDAPILSDKWHPSGALDLMVGGFEVDGSDATKFGTLLKPIMQTHAIRETERGRKFAVEVSGFSDCIGRNERNRKLRLARASVIAMGLGGAGKMDVSVRLDHAATDYLASNATREGRRKNRGVLIRLIPQVTPEKFRTPIMESRFAGVQMSAATPTAQLNRPLSEAEVLAIALTIFSAQSTAFEQIQSWRDVIPVGPPSSSFAEEDLPSNLIGFYRAARGFSINEVRKFCGAWDKERSVRKLKGYKFSPNRTFQARRLPPGGVWPSQLQTITPAAFSSDAFKILRLRLETALVGFNCTIDPKTNSVKC